MNPVRTAKLLSRFSSGLLSAAEVANTLLMDLVSDGDAELQPFVSALPGEVREALLNLLRNIRNTGYRWKPFLIGFGDTPDANPEILQRICTELCIT
jgi:hypothetical protein